MKKKKRPSPAPARKSDSATPTTARPTATASSAAPLAAGKTAATTTPSRQKGVASARYIWRDVSKLQALNVSWTYGWSPWVPASTPTLDSVPMVARPSDATSTVIKALTQGRIAGSYHELLGFNEPDSAKQANMTPQQAIDLWPMLESTGLPLGSPAPADVTDGWLDQFMTLAAHAGRRVDFIALHFYVDFTDPTAVARIKSTVQSVHDRYGKPVWVTEIGTVDIRPWGLKMVSAPTPAAAQTFLTAVTTMFASIPTVVARYAWFADNCWSTTQYQPSSLYDGSDRLTALGQAFSRVQ